MGLKLFYGLYGVYAFVKDCESRKKIAAVKKLQISVGMQLWLDQISIFITIN